MKQCLMIAMMTLGMAAPALAGDLNCFQKFGKESLNIHEFETITADLRVVKKEVFVLLNTPTQILKFDGKIIFGAYDLYDDQGQSVDLAVKTIPVEYGGGCKRCGPQIIEKTFAKLTLANGEVHDFECE
jgi:hypothetical protein